ncbi:hypothetical protein D3C78_1689630 [compost metagenome]
MTVRRLRAMTEACIWNSWSLSASSTQRGSAESSTRWQMLRLIGSSSSVRAAPRWLRAERQTSCSFSQRRM